MTATYRGFLVIFIVGSLLLLPACKNNPPDRVSSIRCEDFSNDLELCNKSSDAQGNMCYFSEADQACLIKTTKTPADQSLDKLGEKQRQQKAENTKKGQEILGNRSMGDYCQMQSIDMNDAALVNFHEAIALLRAGANDGAAFCGDELGKLEGRKITPAIKICKKALMTACIDPKDYAERFLKSINKLSQQGERDTSYLNILIRELEKRHKPQLGHAIWGVKQIPRSYFKGEDWLLDTPRYEDFERSKISHRQIENFLLPWENAIASAEHFVDITSLVVPEDDFFSALRRALVALDRKNKEITVRILFGTHLPVIGLKVDANQVYKDLINSLPNNKRTKLKIYIGSFASSEILGIAQRKYFSWNHSKIVAVDDEILLTGGHNLFRSYLSSENPVHDISLRLPGKIAEIGHRFCDFLWGFTERAAQKTIFNLGKYGDIATNQPEIEKFSLSYINEDLKTSKLGQEIDTSIPEDKEGFVKVIAAGRLANTFYKTGHHYYNVSDSAKLTMIKDAEDSIYISQQAIHPIIFKNQFNSNVIKELILAMMRGVDVFILKSSSKKEIAGEIDAYNSGLDRRHTFQFFYQEAMALGGVDKDDLRRKLFAHFYLLDTGKPRIEVPNHAKVLIVDAKAVSVGSHNLYDDSHAEFEVILQNSRLLLDYYAQFWLNSFATATGVSFSEKKAKLQDYEENTYVFVLRNSHEDKPRRSFTLARVIKVMPDEVRVETDFLIKEDAEIQRITEPEHIRAIRETAR